MVSPPPFSPAERLSVLARLLCEAIAGQQLGRVLGGRIAGPLVVLLMARLKFIRDRFADLAGRIVAGTYTPRRYAPRRAPEQSQPRSSPRPDFGWLASLLPDAPPHRGRLLALLDDPETVALIAAAPGPMARLLRPLCWMLKVKPPPVLASPRRPAGTPPPAAVAYRPPPPRPPPSPAPSNTLGLFPIQLSTAGVAPKSA